MTFGGDFVMTDSDFNFIRKEVYGICGIVLGDHKKQMVYSRLTRRIRALNLRSFSDYIGYLKNHKEAELSEFVNAITTNLTSFFRENHHFDFLKAEAMQALLKENRSSRKIRAWSAGCSTGEEPYSILMTIMDVLPKSGWDFKLLATDLDSNVLAKAAAGVYNLEQVQELPESYQRRWFTRVADSQRQPQCEVRDELKAFAHFKRLNLLAQWPMKGPFDIIFCRNVLIYFDQQTKDKLIDRYAKLLRPGGYLFIGHSESMKRDHGVFDSLGHTIYRKK